MDIQGETMIPGVQIIPPVDKSLSDAIILEIAKRYPYSISDVRSAYETVHSFDATIKACEAAARLGMPSPLNILRFSDDTRR